MRKRLITAFILIFYSAFIIKLLVFKFDLIKIGHLRFKFSPETGEGNVVPFKTILFYLRGRPTWSMAILNLVGNIALFVPIGFLLPLVYRKMTWLKCLVIA